MEALSPFEQAAKAGKLETFDLGGGFRAWVNGTAEGKIEITEAARHEGKTGLRWTVTVDWEHDGGEGGNYPIGWPRISRSFKPGELDLSRYESLVFWIRTDSSRDKADVSHTPIGLVIRSHAMKKTALREDRGSGLPTSDLDTLAILRAGDHGCGRQQRGTVEVDQPRTTVHLRKQLSARNPTGLRRGRGTRQRMREPTLIGLDAPHHLLLPCRSLSLTFEAAGHDGCLQGQPPDHRCAGKVPRERSMPRPNRT